MNPKPNSQTLKSSSEVPAGPKVPILTNQMNIHGTPSRLDTTIKLHHTNFLAGMDALMQSLEQFKKSFDGHFSDITQQSLDLEDQLNDVFLQKKVILNRYEVLQRKEKEGCKTCLDLETQLRKKSGIIIQYEVKLKNIANLLHINTTNTEANQKYLLSNIINAEQVQSRNSPCDDIKDNCVVEKEDELEENVSPENSQKKNKHEQGSKILVHEKEDEEYFETTIRRRTPENAETVMDIPETFCEDFSRNDHPRKGPVSYETPSKKRKLAQLSPNANNASQRPPNLNRAANQTDPPLSPRNENLADMKERNATTVMSLVTKPQLRSAVSLCNSPSLITKPKLKSKGGESEGRLVKDSDDRDKKQGKLPRVSQDEDGEDIHEDNSDNETRFPLLDKDINKESQEDITRPNSCKESTSKPREKKMNVSKVWENIEFSDDESDDFVETNKKSKQQAISNEEDRNASFAFAKPAAADTSKSKWKLKVAGSSVNKTKLKQTKLSMEKKVGKIDITQIEGYNGGYNPTANSQKSKDNSETSKETLDSAQKRLIIEETQLQSEEESDTDKEAEKEGRGLKMIRKEPDKHTCGNESSDSTSDTEGKIRVRPLSQLTLPDESMLFQPNAASTQKTKNQVKNTNTCKQTISTRKCGKITLPARYTKQSPTKKNEGSCVTPKSGNRSNLEPAAASFCNVGRSNGGKPLFLPKEAKESKAKDFTSKWTCPECIDYYVDGYGAGILKIRPPPKKCGHNGKYPATPPDFWDPMCS